jgi:hypothetical protein
VDVELRGIETGFYFRPIERRGNWSAGMRSQNIGCGDCLGARNLQVIEIDFGFLAAGNGARRGEQAGIVVDHQNG